MLVLLNLTFRYAGFLMWCPLLAIPKPNPTWVSGNSSSGITVEETGTITLSAVPASLSMLYKVGPAATEARRAAKTSRCILAADLTHSHTMSFSLSAIRQPCGLLVTQAKKGWKSLFGWIYGSKDHFAKIRTNFCRRKLGGCAHQMLVSSGLVCVARSSCLWLQPTYLPPHYYTHASWPWSAKSSDTDLDSTLQAKLKPKRIGRQAPGCSYYLPAYWQHPLTHPDLGTKLLLIGFLVYGTVLYSALYQV